MVYPVYIHIAFDTAQLLLFIYLFIWTAQQGVVMPDGTKSWTEMKTGDSESAETELLSEQGPCLWTGGWRVGRAAKAVSRLSLDMKSQGREALKSTQVQRGRWSGTTEMPASELGANTCMPVSLKLLA